MKILGFVDGKSSNDIINIATMSDEVVASYGPAQSLSRCNCVCPLEVMSVSWFVCQFVCYFQTTKIALFEGHSSIVVLIVVCHF